MSAPVADPAGLRRGFAFLVLVALLVLGMVADRAVTVSRAEGSFVRGEDAPALESLVEVPREDTLSSAWYCAAGGASDQTVVIANSGEGPVEAAVTVMSGGTRPTRRLVEVAPRSRVQVPVSEVAEVEEPGVLVELFGGTAAVEHVIDTGADLDVGPCARRPATRWLFAGGTTVKEARHTLALFNPFHDDAIVDMTFYTKGGVEQPADLQAFLVPGRSRVSVPVHDHVLRKALVASELLVRTGRIVAEQVVTWEGGSRRGLSLTLGVEEPSGDWAFPEGLLGEGVTEQLWILNPGTTDTQVQVLPQVGEGASTPQEVPVPARSVVAFPMERALRRPAPHGVRVRAIGQGDVVVFQELAATTSAPRTGYAIVRGVADPARSWLFPAGSADRRHDEWIVVSNPAAEEVSLSISALAGGVLLVPEGLGRLTVPAGGRGSYRLGDALKRSDLPILVEADRPVEVVRGLYRDDAVSLSPGVPFPEE